MIAIRVLVPLVFVACVSANAQDPGLITERPDPDGVATEVSLGLFIVDVVEINDVAQTFQADVIATFSWNDDRLALPPEAGNRPDRILSVNDIWQPALTLINRRNVQTFTPDVARVSSEGRVVVEVRRFAELASPLDLRDFPFDRQVLRFDVASTRYGPDDLEVVVDDATSGRLGDFSVAGWDIEQGDTTVSHITLQGGRERFVRVVHHLYAARDAGFFLTKVIVPLSLIVFMAAAVFWVDPEHIGPQLGISTASVLTLIAFQFSLVRMLPPVSYLTRIDLFILGSMLLVFMALAEAIHTSRITKRGRLQDARKMDTYARGIYAGLFVLLVLFTLVL